MSWTRIFGSNISNTTKAIIKDLSFYSPSGVLSIPVGTTAQRPTLNVNLGTIRYNLTRDSAEIYNTQTGVADWNGIGSETGVDGGDVIIRTNGTTITKDITIGPIANGDQKYTYGFLMGDITIDDGVTVDIESGSGLLIYDEPVNRIIPEETIVKTGLYTWLDAGNNLSYPGSGTIWTDLASSNQYNINGNPTYLQDTGGVFFLDGSNDNVTLISSSIPTGSEITFGVWIYGTTTSNASSIIEARTAQGSRTLNVHLTWSNSTIYFDTGGNAGGNRLEKVVQSSEYLGWHYWVFVKNATTGVKQIYLDGGLWHSSTGNTLQIEPTSIATIGSYTNNTTYQRGYLSNLHIYDRALSETEINYNYNITRNRFSGSSF